ncbi:MAG: hypothetical protein ABI600_08945 [Luteolibacter sp.]
MNLRGFEDDKDRHGWVDLMEKAYPRFGWRVEEGFGIAAAGNFRLPVP